MNADKGDNDESVNTINELIDSISATTPIRSGEAFSSIDVRQLEETKERAKEPEE